MHVVTSLGGARCVTACVSFGLWESVLPAACVDPCWSSFLVSVCFSLWWPFVTMYGAQELSRCQRYWATRFADRFLGHYWWIWWGLWLRWLSQARSTQGRVDWIRSLHWYCRHQNYIAKHKAVGADASSANWRISNAWSRTTCRRLLCLFIWKMIAKLIACELGMLAGQSVYAIGNPFGLDHSMTLYWNEITIDHRWPTTSCDIEMLWPPLATRERERETWNNCARQAWLRGERADLWFKFKPFKRSKHAETMATNAEEQGHHLGKVSNFGYWREVWEMLRHGVTGRSSEMEYVSTSSRRGLKGLAV